MSGSDRALNPGGSLRVALTGASTYQMPKTPSLFTQLSMGNNSDNARIYGAQTDAIPVKNLQNVQVTLYNT